MANWSLSIIYTSYETEGMVGEGLGRGGEPGLCSPENPAPGATIGNNQPQWSLAFGLGKDWEHFSGYGERLGTFSAMQVVENQPGDR